MMETFIVLGLCFILYEALDFFQGCMHSTQTATSDRIESYRRQITEEKIRSLQAASAESSASVSPIIGEADDVSPRTIKHSPVFSSFPGDNNHRVVTNSYRRQRHRKIHHSHYKSVTSSSTSLPQEFTNNTTNFSSLPRDYYYLQQQKQHNRRTTKFLSKFSSSLSDNRIFPEVCTLPVPATSTATEATQQTEAFDIPPAIDPAPIILDLKRTVFSRRKATSLPGVRNTRRTDNYTGNEDYLSSSDDAPDDDDDYNCIDDNDSDQLKRIFSISPKF